MSSSNLSWPTELIECAKFEISLFDKPSIKTCNTLISEVEFLRALLNDRQIPKFRIDDKVRCNGYDGTISKVHIDKLIGMYDVRLPGGLICVDESDISIEVPSNYKEE